MRARVVERVAAASVSASAAAAIAIATAVAAAAAAVGECRKQNVAQRSQCTIRWGCNEQASDDDVDARGNVAFADLCCYDTL